ncbi:MAG: methyl-accepting chemotaxis protein [Fibrobacterota bacterium]
MFTNLSIRAKIYLLIGLLLTGIVAISGTGITGLNRLRGAAEDLHDKGFGPAEQTLLLHKHLYKLRGDIYKLLLLPEENEKIRGDIKKDLAKIDSALLKLSEMSGNLTDSVKLKIESSRKAVTGYQTAVTAIAEKSQAGDVEFGKTSMKSGDAHAARKIVDIEAEGLLRLVDGEVEAIDDHTIAIGTNGWRISIGLSALLLLTGVIGSYLLARQILNPLQAMSDAISKLGDGDFREGVDSSDGAAEIVAMAASLARTRSKLRGAMITVASTSRESMESASAQLDMTRSLSNEADTNEREAQSAASATEEASITLKTISGGASISMNSLESVSAAIEEMTASVTEIARSADQTRAMTHRALEGARSASIRMNELSTASREIETVIEMIVEISEQTKLLALNATIEAARAGEAGRGFAVVAGEVKELAKGTAEATEDIRKRVEAIRSSTTNAVEEIATVTGSMETLGQNISSIAGAVEEQSVTTREISRNIGEAVQGTREITRNLDAGSTAVTEIARDIQSVLERGRALRRIADTARNLSERSSASAKGLSAEVDKFRV